MKRVMVLIAASAVLGLSSAAIAQSAGGGMSGGSGGASIGPAPGTPGNFTRPRGADTNGIGLTGSGVTGRMPDANRSDNDQNPGNRRPPVQPPGSGASNGSGVPGADSFTPAPIIAPPSPFGAR